MKQWSKEAIENVAQLIEVLQKAEEEQKKMTDEEKRDNAIKMGDIYY